MKHPRVLVYVAGPFSPTPTHKELIKRGDLEPRAAVEENIARAGDLALAVAGLGALPMCPHLNTSLPEFEDVQPYQFWIEGTEEMLLRCDVAIFTDNWAVSSGARGEMATCKRVNIPAFESVEALAAFLAEDDVEKFLLAIRLARVLEAGLARDTIPSPAPLPSVSAAPPATGEIEDFGEIDCSDFEPRSGALDL